MPEKRPYKVVYESITQEKKKLRSQISYQAVAPSGYTFVPVGLPEVTEECKEISRQRGVNVYVVSATPKSRHHLDPNNVSAHIHRIGHHFKNEIVEIACIKTGFKVTKAGKPLAGPQRRTLAPEAIARHLDDHGRRLGFAANEKDPARQQQAVTAAIKDLFPRIPEVDAAAIIRRAFKEGTGRVGTNEELPLAQRVQLAVLAHIRHVKTDYDKLLRTNPRMEARQIIQPLCLAQIVEWRGEADNGVDGQLEDIFEEVIILDDDSDDESPGNNVDDRDSSLEIISDRRRASDVDIEPQAYRGGHGTASTQPDIISVKPVRMLDTSAVFSQQDIQSQTRSTKGRFDQNTVHTQHQHNYVTRSKTANAGLLGNNRPFYVPRDETRQHIGGHETASRMAGADLYSSQEKIHASIEGPEHHGRPSFPRQSHSQRPVSFPYLSARTYPSTKQETKQRYFDSLPPPLACITTQSTTDFDTRSARTGEYGNMPAHQRIIDPTDSLHGRYVPQRSSNVDTTVSPKHPARQSAARYHPYSRPETRLVHRARTPDIVQLHDSPRVRNEQYYQHMYAGAMGHGHLRDQVHVRETESRAAASETFRAQAESSYSTNTAPRSFQLALTNPTQALEPGIQYAIRTPGYGEPRGRLVAPPGYEYRPAVDQTQLYGSSRATQPHR